MSTPPAEFFAAIERNRLRLWALCYRMTGQRADADELAQEAVAKAIERWPQAQGKDPTGWLLRLTARTCLDHLRHRQVERRLTELADPLDGTQWPMPDERARAPDFAAVLREDVRFAVVVALQTLSPRQRSAVILHDVCGSTLAEVAEVLETNPNAAKALLHRGRAALRAARLRDDVDVPVNREVVERFASAIEAGSIERLTALLADDAWGMSDGGGIVQTATKPTFGRKAISRQWSNAKRKLGGATITARTTVLNGEPAVVIRLAGAPEVVVAVVHLDTRGGLVCALRVNRDPRRHALLPAMTEVH